MKDFFQWAEEQKIDLNAVLAEVPDAEETENEGNSAHRAAVRSHAYPPAYGRAQYPDSYFRPTAADAAYYQSIKQTPAAASGGDTAAN